MLAPGDVIAGYRIEKVLGQGGMGVVYEATQLALHRTVALKFLSANYLHDVDFRERFRREGVIQAAIDHPHIVPVYEAGEVSEGLFLAMRLVRGPNLKELIVSGRLDPARSIAILSQVADALDAAHSVGLTHRDIKPQNILVGERDHGYLADFGLTKDSDVSSITRTGQFLGTLDYVAPELVNGELATSSSDIYSFTAVLFECLTGSVPYPRPSEAAVLFAHVSSPPPRVSERRPDLPLDLDVVIARGMCKPTDERPGSARALIDAAAAALGRNGSTAVPPPAETPARRAATTLPKPEPATTEAEIATPVSTEVEVPPPVSTELEVAPVALEVTELEVETLPSPSAEAVTVPVELDDTGETALLDETAETVPIPPTTAPTVHDLRPPPAPPAPARKPDKPEDAGMRRRRIAALVAATVAVVAGAIAGVAFGGAGEKPAPPRRAVDPVTAKAKSMSLTAPGNWRRSDADPHAIPGMTFTDPVALAPAGGGGREVIAGLVKSGDPSLLAGGLRKRLDRVPPHDEAVRLGNVPAYRYAGLAPTGLDRRLELLVVPTTLGVATVACLAPAAQARAFAAGCESVARTLALDGARPYALGPDGAFAARLDKAMAALSKQRVSARRAPRAADRPTPQAQRAGDLAKAFDAAAVAVATGPASPAVADARARIVSSLRAAAARYRKLAAAASAYKRKAFTRARARVTGAEGRVTRALGALRSEGYRVG